MSLTEKDLEMLRARRLFEDVLYQPNASKADGYFTTKPAPPAPSPTPKEINVSSVDAWRRLDSGLTAPRSLQDNPGFRNVAATVNQSISPVATAPTSVSAPPISAPNPTGLLAKVPPGLGAALGAATALPPLWDAIKNLAKDNPAGTGLFQPNFPLYPSNPFHPFNPDNPLSPLNFNPLNPTTPLSPFNPRPNNPLNPLNYGPGKPNPNPLDPDNYFPPKPKPVDPNNPNPSNPNSNIPGHFQPQLPLNPSGPPPFTGGNFAKNYHVYFSLTGQQTVYRANGLQPLIYPVDIGQGVMHSVAGKLGGFRLSRGTDGTGDPVIQLLIKSQIGTPDEHEVLLYQMGGLNVDVFTYTCQCIATDGTPDSNPNPNFNSPTTPPPALPPNYQPPQIPPPPTEYRVDIVGGLPAAANPIAPPAPAPAKPAPAPAPFPAVPPDLIPQTDRPEAPSPNQKPKVAPPVSPAQPNPAQPAPAPLTPPNPVNPLQKPPTLAPNAPNPQPPQNPMQGGQFQPNVVQGGKWQDNLVPPPIINPPAQWVREIDPKKEEDKKLAPVDPTSPIQKIEQNPITIPPIVLRPAGPDGKLGATPKLELEQNKLVPTPDTSPKPKCQDKCMADLQMGQQETNNKLDGFLKGLDAGSNAVNLALLPIINNKLGDQIPNGGISGFLGKFKQAFDKFAEWSHLDRILNILTFTSTLHNAYMLSNGLTQTLFSMFSNVLAASGFPGTKDKEGNPLDIGKIVGDSIENLAKSVLGVQTVDGIKAEWKKYSRIYQAAANIVWSVQSIGQSILGALEIVGSMVAKIGNALKRFGAIGEKAFGWMNVTPNYQNRFFTTLEKVEEVTSNIDSVASEVLSVQETITQIGTQKSELEKAYKQEDNAKQGKDLPEASKVKASEDKAKTDSNSPTIPPEAERKPE